MARTVVSLLFLISAAVAPLGVRGEDYIRALQKDAVLDGRAAWGHWGPNPDTYSSWGSHSNRLIPVYTFGISLDRYQGENSPYRSKAALQSIYGYLPSGTLNPEAEYFDQTDIYRMQKHAAAAGKKKIILIVFDGMDWQTTYAAAIYKSGKVGYDKGRGTGLLFQDYRRVETDFGYMVTSPHSSASKCDVNSQTIDPRDEATPGGYDWRLGGDAPWSMPSDLDYLIGKSKARKHAYTDSASSATSMTCGVKTYNVAVNVDAAGRQTTPISRELQAAGFAIGVVTSVPISHATPACAYANNVHRDDYQDLTRDLLGLPSIAHPDEPPPGVDVLLGAGWGQNAKEDTAQGQNFFPGNKYLTADDLKQIDVRNGGRYVVAQRTKRAKGSKVLKMAARKAIGTDQRLFGFFGGKGGHLPFRTADGKYDPTVSTKQVTNGAAVVMPEVYKAADVEESPTLAEMSVAALDVLADKSETFWLMIEPGDVDWANHANNIDNSIGAVLSGDDAFRSVVEWIEQRDCWDETAVILTADHGHYLFLDDPAGLLPPSAVAE